jgi:hypothetical protein
MISYMVLKEKIVGFIENWFNVWRDIVGVVIEHHYKIYFVLFNLM